jgi:hypothetical protein
MKSDKTASVMLSLMFACLILSSLFIAPSFLSARATDDGQAELIRQHFEAMSPYGVLEEGYAAEPGGMCEDQAEVERHDTPVVDTAPDEPMIRAVGRRAKLTQV